MQRIEICEAACAGKWEISCWVDGCLHLKDEAYEAFEEAMDCPVSGSQAIKASW